MYDLNYYEEMKLAEEGDLDAMFNVAAYIIWGDQTAPVEPEAAELAVRYYKANAENGEHIHYDEYNSLENGSTELIIERIGEKARN